MSGPYRTATPPKPDTELPCPKGAECRHATDPEQTGLGDYYCIDYLTWPECCSVRGKRWQVSKPNG